MSRNNSCKQRTAAGFRVQGTQVAYSMDINKPTSIPRCDQSVIYYQSPHMAPPEDGEWSSYDPVEGGGFFIRGGKHILTRPIVQGMNHLITGDRPKFALKTGTGAALAGFDAEDSAFHLFGRDSTGSWNQVWPTLGYLELGVVHGSGDVMWLHEIDDIATTFMPGYTHYEIEKEPELGRLNITVAPLMGGHGLVCKVATQCPVSILARSYGMTWASDRSWAGPEYDDNEVEFIDGSARLTEFNMGNVELWFGVDARASGSKLKGTRGDEAQYITAEKVQSLHVVMVWGVTDYDTKMADQMMRRLDTKNTSTWRQTRDELKQSWFEAIIGRALEPRQKFVAAMQNPADELQRTIAWWDARRAQFQVNTPDSFFNCLMSWVYTTTQYNQLGPGLTNGGSESDAYGHLSPGWWGKTWCGDHESHKTCLRLYGALQLDDETYPIPDRDAPNRHYSYIESVDGAIPWICQSLEPAIRENHNPFWVDQVWWNYCWTADEQFIRDLWPAVKKAVDWQCRMCDPDGDGLFREHYGFWTGDNGGEGPKAVTVTVTSWAMLNRAAKMARIVGDEQAEKSYQTYADKSYSAIQHEMWREKEGVLGSIGGDGIWREHMQSWNECLAVEFGAITLEQGRKAMRWVESHFGFNPNPGIHLMMSSDWFPLRWSLQFVHTGDTCRAALAGLKVGDADVWWKYISTIVRASFNGRYPGVNYGVNNKGASAGIEEQLDSTDAHIHMAVRGLYGITPAIHEDRLHIAPNFPNDWMEASIKTPDFSYTYKREGNTALFDITSVVPLIKVVRGNLTGEEVTTNRESRSTVKVNLGEPVAYQRPKHKPTIRIKGVPSDQQMESRTIGVVNFDQALQLGESGLVRPTQLTRDERRRQVMIDLREHYNVGYRELAETQFIFDYDDKPIPLRNFWGLPVIIPPEGKSCGANRHAGLWPHQLTLDASTGTRFLIADTQCTGYPEHPRLIALSITPPYPLPASATIAIGRKCDQVWPLMQSYAHAMKNYIPNGEILLRYADGVTQVEQLIPPYNMDTYFQHYSLKGVPVPLGKLFYVDPWGSGFDNREVLISHADALRIDSNPACVLKEIEFRSVCTESIIAVAALTVVESQ